MSVARRYENSRAATLGFYAYLYNGSHQFPSRIHSPKAFNMQSGVKLPPLARAKSKAKSCAVVFHGDSCVIISHELQHQLNFVMREGELNLGRPLRVTPTLGWSYRVINQTSCT